jgi:hypothetical protein
VDAPAIIMSFSWKVLGKPKVYHKQLPDYKDYRRNPTSDKALVRDLWAVLNAASVVVGHNFASFDSKLATSKFAYYQMKNPNYGIVDTLRLARNRCRFFSNSLSDLCEHLGIGSKSKATHADLWEDCLNSGSPKKQRAAWAKLRAYNNMDCVLTEKLLRRLKEYSPPNKMMNVLTDPLMVGLWLLK